MTLVEKGGKTEKRTLIVTWQGTAAGKRAFAPSACCPADRLKLVPATDCHSCCILNPQETQRNLRDILPPWQRDTIEREYPNPVHLTMPIIRSSVFLDESIK